MVTWQAFRITANNTFEKKELKRFEGFEFLFLFGFVFFPTCNFFLEYDPRFSVAPFQMKLNRFDPVQRPSLS